MSVSVPRTVTGLWKQRSAHLDQRGGTITHLIIVSSSGILSLSLLLTNAFNWIPLSFCLMNASGHLKKVHFHHDGYIQFQRPRDISQLRWSEGDILNLFIAFPRYDALPSPASCRQDVRWVESESPVSRRPGWRSGSDARFLYLSVSALGDLPLHSISVFLTPLHFSDSLSYWILSRLILYSPGAAVQ